MTRPSRIAALLAAAAIPLVLSGCTAVSGTGVPPGSGELPQTLIAEKQLDPGTVRAVDTIDGYRIVVARTTGGGSCILAERDGAWASGCSEHGEVGLSAHDLREIRYDPAGFIALDDAWELVADGVAVERR